MRGKEDERCELEEKRGRGQLIDKSMKMKGELSPYARGNEPRMQATMKVVYFARLFNSLNSNNHHRAFWMCCKIIQYALARLWVYEYDLYLMCMWKSNISIKDM